MKTSSPFAVLMYHSLSDGRWPDPFAPKFTIPLSRFSEHIRFIKDAGYVLGDFADVNLRVREGRGFPGQYCVISLDDGHKSGLEMAEVLNAHGTPATFFLTRDYCLRRADFLNAADIRLLQSAGFDLGTHGTSHRPLAGRAMDEVRTELADSKKWLEDLLGRAVDSMSLPGGSANREVIRLAWETGYDLVGTSRERMNRLVSLPSTVDRFVVQHGYGVRHIARMLHGSLSYVAPRGVRALLVWLPKKLLRTAERRRAD